MWIKYTQLATASSNWLSEARLRGDLLVTQDSSSVIGSKQQEAIGWLLNQLAEIGEVYQPNHYCLHQTYVFRPRDGQWNQTILRTIVEALEKFFKKVRPNLFRISFSPEIPPDCVIQAGLIMPATRF